jgi:hypothetical protein
MRRWLEGKEHLVRMAGLFVVGIAVFLVLQQVLVPAGFGKYGHYRAGALADNRARPLRYAGRAACEACHTDVVEARHGSKHERVNCEACHGPLAAHADAPNGAKPTRPNGRNLCLRCHEVNVARPAKFPQIQVADHSPEGPCTECHRPHAPQVFQ